MTREIHYQPAAVPEPPTAASNLQELTTLHELDAVLSQRSTSVDQSATRELPWSPRVRQRDVVATCGDCRELGRLLTSRAWHPSPAATWNPPSKS